METTSVSKYPIIGEKVVKVGEILFLNWNNMDITNINIIFYKGLERIPLTNKEVIDGQNSFSIFIDSSYFTEEFLECKVRLEMKENPNIFIETDHFKILRSDDRSA
jgi:hypothetical protein